MYDLIKSGGENMNKETKSQLDTLIDKYEQRLVEAKTKQEQIKSEEEAFLSEFKRLREGVIRTTMEEIGAHLKVRGHDYRISETEESVEEEGRTQDAEITFSIFPAGIDRSFYKPENTPSISFTAPRYKKKISVHGSNMMPNRGGSAGPRGEFKAEEINSALVEREVLGVLEEIFDPKW
jgi:hypothetical protein